MYNCHNVYTYIVPDVACTLLIMECGRMWNVNHKTIKNTRFYWNRLGCVYMYVSTSIDSCVNKGLMIVISLETNYKINAAVVNH